MQHKIDPTVDCVFKAILGKDENKTLLIHFLNAVLNPKKGQFIQNVSILNPYNEREFEDDKLSIVDIKAEDEAHKLYHIEIQLATHAALKERILYIWSTLYHSLIGKGENFTQLKPVISIWLVNENLFPEIDDYHVDFGIYNLKRKISLTTHLAIHILQLPQWRERQTTYREVDRWMYFFKHGKELDIDHPPIMLQTEEMKQAMAVLHHFSESQKDFLLYQKRLDAERVEATWKKMLQQAQQQLEQARQESEQARQESEQARQESEQARQEKELLYREKSQERREKERILKEKEVERQEKERLLALLRKAGIDPNAS